MQQNIDLIELLAALNAEGVRYLIVGAYALGFHGRPRATKDADIFVAADPENAKKLWKTLVNFGAPLEELRPIDLSSPGTIFIMGRPPNQIDILTEIDGVTFHEAWASRAASTFCGVPVNYIGRAELVRNKKTVGRPQDLADVAYLEGDATSEY